MFVNDFIVKRRLHVNKCLIYEQFVGVFYQRITLGCKGVFLNIYCKIYSQLCCGLLPLCTIGKLPLAKHRG